MRADLQAVRHPSDGGGTAAWTAVPPALQAGSATTLSFRFTTGPLGIAEGGSLWVVPSPFWGWSRPQDLDPLGPGFTAISPPDDVVLETTLVEGMLQAVVQGRALEPGEVVDIVYGVGDSARADRFAEHGPAVWIAVDGDGDGVRQVLATPLVADVIARDAAMLVATLPSAAQPGQSVLLRVAALDDAGNGLRPAPLKLTVTADPSLGGPDAIDLTASPDGTATVTMTPSAAGVFVVGVAGPDGMATSTNPMVVREGAVPILWADLHIHTALSDGTGEPTAVYRYARNVAGLDVAAITDHDHWGLVFLDRHPELVDGLAAAAEAAQEDGRFVAVHGYEWTSWLYGHRHVLWFGAPEPWRSSMDERFDTPAELWASLRGHPVLTIPHHPAGGPVPLDWSIASDPELEPVVEVASVHGQSESPDLPGVIYDAVAGGFVAEHVAGQRLGFVGSGDSHDGHPGLPEIAADHGGLAALEGAVATRESVYDTLRARRVYATNGPRIVLRFTAADRPMGSVLPAGVAAPIEVRVVGTAPIERIELVGRAGVVGSRTGDGRHTAHATWTLDAPADGDFAYVRVVQVDGGLAWSSPVWFDVVTAGSAPPSPP
jgi:hypothetical protein